MQHPTSNCSNCERQLKLRLVFSSPGEKSVVHTIFCITFDLHGVLWSQTYCFFLSLETIVGHYLLTSWDARDDKSLCELGIQSSSFYFVKIPFELSCFFGIVSVYGNACVCMLTGRCVCACGGLKLTWSVSLDCSTHYILKQGLCWNWSLLLCLIQWVSFVPGITGKLPYPLNFYVKFGNLNSDPHTWEVSCLVGEPSHLPLSYSSYLQKLYQI